MNQADRDRLVMLKKASGWSNGWMERAQIGRISAARPLVAAESGNARAPARTCLPGAG